MHYAAEAKNSWLQQQWIGKLDLDANHRNPKKMYLACWIALNTLHAHLDARLFTPLECESGAVGSAHATHEEHLLEIHF